jgi:adenylate cyclase
VVVNYIGDELLAMWGAPREQRDHAERACRSALAMKAALPALNERWRARLKGEAVAVGVGINTGVAQVGNIGTRSKLLYGPLGPTVNMASRVQGATKHLQTDVLITGATRKKLGEGLSVRRLCRAALLNVEEHVDLFELSAPGVPRWDELRDRYEAALSEFERQEFRSAVRLLGALLPEFRADGPSLVLLKRAVNALVDGAEQDHPIWKLTAK